MTVAILATQSVTRGRQTKFTPEKIQQISNLVERGKSRDEIAEIVGVTPATLAVTCSRLKISLRRPTFDLGTGLLRHRRRPSPNGVYSHQSNGHGEKKASEKMEERLQPLSAEAPMKEVGAVAPHSQAVSGKTSYPASPKFGIRTRYKSEDRTIELPLGLDIVGRLAIEAEFRDMRVGELVARLILAIAEKDLFQLVLEQAASGAENVERISSD
jgi:hypothetical protein